MHKGSNHEMFSIYSDNIQNEKVKNCPECDSELVLCVVKSCYYKGRHFGDVAITQSVDILRRECNYASKYILYKYSAWTRCLIAELTN